jgi:hypothetical protein
MQGAFYAAFAAKSNDIACVFYANVNALTDYRLA